MKNTMENFNLDDIKKGGKKPTLPEQEGDWGDDEKPDEKPTKNIEETASETQIKKDIQDIEDSYK